MSLQQWPTYYMYMSILENIFAKYFVISPYIKCVLLCSIYMYMQAISWVGEVVYATKNYTHLFIMYPARKSYISPPQECFGIVQKLRYCSLQICTPRQSSSDIRKSHHDSQHGCSMKNLQFCSNILVISIQQQQLLQENARSMAGIFVKCTRFITACK